MMLIVAAWPASSRCTTLAYAAIAADVVTTVGAIESGRGAEANPIYPKGDLFYPALGAFALVRAYAVYRVDGWHRPVPITMEMQDGRVQTVYGIKSTRPLNCAIAGVTLAAAGNNAAVWAGGDNSERLIGAALGASIAVFTWSFQ